MTYELKGVKTFLGCSLRVGRRKWEFNAWLKLKDRDWQRQKTFTGVPGLVYNQVADLNAADLKRVSEKWKKRLYIHTALCRYTDRQYLWVKWRSLGMSANSRTGKKKPLAKEVKPSIALTNDEGDELKYVEASQ